MVETWLRVAEINEKIRKSKYFQEQVLKQIQQDFMNQLSRLDLQKERALLKRHPNYKGPYHSDLVLEFEYSPIALQIPYGFYLLGDDDLVSLVTSRIESILLDMGKNEGNSREVLDAKTFLSWLYEDNRKLPIPLTKTDMLILFVVSNLHFFQDVHVLHSARRVIQSLNLRERDRTTIERRMRYLKETCAWRPKFANNLAPLGFITVFIEWNEKNKWLKPKIPMQHLALLDVQHPLVECGIYQIPLHWPLVDVIEEVGGLFLDSMHLSLNLNYLRPEELTPYQRKKIKSANFPIMLQPHVLSFSTNTLSFPLNPNWSNSAFITDHMIRIIKFFSDSKNNIDRYTVLTKHLGISRNLFSEYLKRIVKMKILYYFPQFVKIGMDDRVIILLREKESKLRENILSGLSRAPRMLSFSGPQVSLAFLNVGSKQVPMLNQEVKKLQEEFDILFLSNLISGEHYILQNVPFHRFEVKRREDDKKLLFYLPEIPEPLMGVASA